MVGGTFTFGLIDGVPTFIFSATAKAEDTKDLPFEPHFGKNTLNFSVKAPVVGRIGVKGDLNVVEGG